MWNIFRKKLPKRLLVCVGIPYDKKTFYATIGSGADFLNVICSGCTEDEAWNKYKETSELLQTILDDVKSRGGDVMEIHSPAMLNCINEYDAVILIAHHIVETGKVELFGNAFDTKQIIGEIPEDFCGDLDLTVCYSASLIAPIKLRCHDRCHVLAPKEKTSLRLRLVICQSVLRRWIEERGTYIQAFDKTISLLQEQYRDKDSVKIDSVDGAIYLGNKLQSSVFAPKNAVKGEPFIVQLAIHKDSEQEEVSLIARTIDDTTRLAQQKPLNLKLKKGDQIEVMLSNAAGEQIIIDGKKNIRKKKTVCWNNTPTKVEFAVIVPQDSSANRFVGQILLRINKLPVADMLFSTNLVDKQLNNDACADFELRQYDAKTERKEEAEKLRLRLQEQLLNIDKQLTEARCSENIKTLEQEKEFCQKMLLMLEEQPHIKKNPVLKVFVSSTSDMKNYRLVAKQQIESCSMFAEMYENWQQSNEYPRDVCCQKVLDSDIFCCILGAKYGFVEPSWNLSMTEIEYRTAMRAGIPVLIYIIEDYEKGIEDLHLQDPASANAQRSLINEITTKRMVEFFKDEFGLALVTRGEFVKLKEQMEHERILKL